MMRSDSGVRSTSARDVTISATYRPPPCSRHRRRNAAFVMPAIGASTTGVSTVSGPRVSGGSRADAEVAGAVILTIVSGGRAAPVERCSGAEETLGEVALDLRQSHALLRHGVAVANGDRLVLECVEVHRDAVRGAALVLA